MSRSLLALLVAGWLADALASQDRDVKAGIAAHERGDHAEALARYDAAQERLGERPEIHFDRGLALLASGDTEGARTAFERGTESDRDDVRSSSFYELGNLSFDAEDWEGAISSYVECLKIRPDHGSAKWNLELALLKKAEQEKEEQENQENQEGDGEENEDEEQQEGDEEQPEQNQDQSQDGDEEQEQDSGEQEEQKDQPESGDEGEQEEEQDPGEQEPDEQEPQPPEEPADSPSDESKQPEQPPQAQPIDRANLDKALEGLDAEDNFMLTRPGGRARKVEKDW